MEVETASTMKPVDYFATHPVFRFEDFASAHQEGGACKAATSVAALKQHVCSGNLLRIQRGLYAVVPPGQTPDTLSVDPYVLATHLAPDAVVGYHGALQFHGKAHSLSRSVPFLTCTKVKPLWSVCVTADGILGFEQGVCFESLVGAGSGSDRRCARRTERGWNVDDLRAHSRDPGKEPCYGAGAGWMRTAAGISPEPRARGR